MDLRGPPPSAWGNDYRQPPPPPCNHLTHYPGHYPYPQQPSTYPYYPPQPSRPMDFQSSSCPINTSYQQAPHPPPGCYQHYPQPAGQESNPQHLPSSTAVIPQLPSTGSSQLNLHALFSSREVDENTKNQIEKLLRGSVRRIVPLGSFPRNLENEHALGIKERPLRNTTPTSDPVAELNQDHHKRSSTPKPRQSTTQLALKRKTTNPFAPDTSIQDSTSPSLRRRTQSITSCSSEIITDKTPTTNDKNNKRRQRAGTVDSRHTLVSNPGPSHDGLGSPLGPFIPVQPDLAEPTTSGEQHERGTSTDEDTIEQPRGRAVRNTRLDSPVLPLRPMYRRRLTNMHEKGPGRYDSDIDEASLPGSPSHRLSNLLDLDDIQEDFGQQGYDPGMEDHDDVDDDDDEPENFKVDEQSKPTPRPTKSNKAARAERIIRHPDRLLLTGDDRCEPCKRTTRIKKECWIIASEGPGKCAPCARSGGLCPLTSSINVGPSHTKSPAATSSSYRTSAARDELRKQMGQVDGYAKAIQTLIDTYDDEDGQDGANYAIKADGANYAIKAVGALIKKMNAGVQRMNEVVDGI